MEENAGRLEASGGVAETPADLEARFQLPDASGSMSGSDSFNGLLRETQRLQEAIAQAVDSVESVAELEERWQNITNRWGALAEKSVPSTEAVSVFSRSREVLGDLLAALDRAVSCRAEIEEVANAHAGLETPPDDDYEARWQIAVPCAPTRTGGGVTSH